jgi:hypothetical protein
MNDLLHEAQQLFINPHIVIALKAGSADDIEASFAQITRLVQVAISLRRMQENVPLSAALGAENRHRRSERPKPPTHRPDLR